MDSLFDCPLEVDVARPLLLETKQGTSCLFQVGDGGRGARRCTDGQPITDRSL